MIEVVIYLALMWALYTIYKQIFVSNKKNSCSKCNCL